MTANDISTDPAWSQNVSGGDAIEICLFSGRSVQDQTQETAEYMTSPRLPQRDV